MKLKINDILGYVYDPVAHDGPYVGLILYRDAKPIVSLHQSRAEAERAVTLHMAILRHNLGTAPDLASAQP